MPKRIFSSLPFVSIFKHLLHTSLFTAACAVAMCMGAERLMLGHLPPFLSPLHYLIIGSTLLEYNVHHLFNAKPPANARFANWPHWLMAAVGVTYHVGREANSVYNEKWNGVETGVFQHLAVDKLYAFLCVIE